MEVTQECLDSNVLEILPNIRSVLNDKYRIKLFNNETLFTFKYKTIEYKNNIYKFFSILTI